MNGSAGAVLGSVVLRDFEVPEKVSFGGSQLVKIHRLPGGGRVVDAMGSDEADVAWAGVMLGRDASDRARLVDGIRRSGQPVLLLFGDMAFDVLVVRFDADYRNPAWIGHYRIRCLVLSDSAAPEPSLYSMVAQDLDDALQYGLTGSMGDTETAIVNAQNSLVSSGNLVGGGSILLLGQLSAVQAASMAIESQCEMSMQDTITAGQASGSIGGAIGLNITTEDAGALAKSAAVNGLMARSSIALQDGES